MARAAAIELITPRYQRPADIEPATPPARGPHERKTYDWSAIRSSLVEPEQVLAAEPEMLFFFAD